MVKKYKKLLPQVSVVIVHRNSSTTIIHTLESLKKQDYPVKEVIIVDNNSKKNSLDLIEKFSAKNKSLNIRTIEKKTDTGQSNSFNIGVKSARSNFVILMQADGVLPRKCEISLIMKPVLDEKDVVASISITLMPKFVWNKYNFWEKSVFSPAVDKKSVGFNSKFNYVSKKKYLEAGGYDEVNFNKDVGGEDADFSMRVRRLGKIVETPARVVHLHYIGDDYSLKDLISSRKLFARTYGRIIRIHNFSLPKGLIVLLIKPVLAFASLIPALFPYNILTMFAFSLLYMKPMYTTQQTLSNPRIILLPFVTFILIYYETFWMLEQFFSPVKKWEGVK